jgi:hypothetical protein
MAQKHKAVDMVVDYIIANHLYSFESLSDETQEKLANAYGEDFGNSVNRRLEL